MLGGGKDDLVDFAVSLQARIDDLHRAVDEVAAGLVARRPAGRRVPWRTTSIVRYDAYEDTGGHQSASRRAARLGARSGIVVSAIQGRDYARIYMKELERGRASIALSPEEQEAVERAMSQVVSRRLDAIFQLSLQQVLGPERELRAAQRDARFGVRTCSCSRARPR